MSFLTVGGIVFSVLILSVVFYFRTESQVKSDLKERAEIFRDVTFDSENRFGDIIKSIPKSDMRVTVVDGDGVVIFDNTVTDISTLENHKDRTEIKNAIENGTGESSRFSKTLSKETWYYAVRLGDGNILRISKTTESVFALFASVIPLILIIMILILVVVYFAAGNSVKKIVGPLNDFEFSDFLSGNEFNLPYEELAPFSRTIKEQHDKINRQIKKIEKRNATISAITENMSEGVILISESSKIISVNHTVREIFNINTDIIKHNIVEIIRDEVLLTRISSALGGERSETLINKNKKVYNVYFSPVAKIGAILLFVDITERTQAEKLRREFTANVSHELKTPLTSISGYSELFLNNLVDEDDKINFIEKIYSESQRMLSLIDDIMLLSKLDEGTGVFNDKFVNVNLLDIAENAVKQLETKAEQSGISLQVKGKNRVVKGVPSMLTDLFINLIDNGIKYGNRGGSVTVEIDDECVKFIDTGIGIPADSLLHIFDRFYRVDKSRSKKTGGTGLGLAIAKHIAMVHSFDIVAESEVGKGSIFKVFTK
jgi:two-component system phosphate regulon sensor histidine kinase PhoR